MTFPCYGLFGALRVSLRHPVGGRDPQEGGDEDADNSFGAAWVWAAVGGCRASASATRCCACCEVKTWRYSRAPWAVTAATLSGWQDTFLSAGEASRAPRSTNWEALETERLKAKLGEMLLERELPGAPCL